MQLAGRDGLFYCPPFCMLSKLNKAAAINMAAVDSKAFKVVVNTRWIFSSSKTHSGGKLLNVLSAQHPGFEGAGGKTTESDMSLH